jgi:hypothetical protein
MNTPLLKIYGERNTGTHYLSELFRLNTDVVELPGVVPKNVMRLQKILPGNERVRDIYFRLFYHSNLGWKHTLVKSHEELQRYRIVDENLSFVTLTKNPYSWLLSLHRRPYHQYYAEDIDFFTFLQTPWQTVGRDGIIGTLSNPVALWNIKNAGYLQLSNSLPTMNVRFEDLLDDPEQVIDSVCGYFGFSRKGGQFINYNQSTKETGKDSDYYRDYYLNERWKDKLTKKEIEVITASLDRNIMNRFGYKSLAA